MSHSEKVIVVTGPVAKRFAKVIDVGVAITHARQVKDVTASAPTNALRVQKVSSGPGEKVKFVS